MADVGGLGAFKGVNPYAGFSKSSSTNPAATSEQEVRRDGFESSNLPPLLHLKSKRFEGSGETARAEESRAISELISKEAQQSPGQELIVAGDFNEVPSSQPTTLQEFLQAENARWASGAQPIHLDQSHSNGWTPADEGWMSSDDLAAAFKALPKESRSLVPGSFEPLSMSDTEFLENLKGSTTYAVSDSKLESSLGEFLMAQLKADPRNA